MFQNWRHHLPLKEMWYPLHQKECAWNRFILESNSGIKSQKQLDPFLAQVQGLCIVSHWQSLTVRETWVQSLGGKDPLEKETATHSSILAWKIPWTEESGRLQSIRLQRAGHSWAHMHLAQIHCFQHTQPENFLFLTQQGEKEKKHSSPQNRGISYPEHWRQKWCTENKTFKSQQTY